MSGPYVIVNRYAEEAWTYRAKVSTWRTRAEAELVAVAQRKRLALDKDESTVMPLAQYLVEYGV